MFIKDSKPMGSGAADHSDNADKFGFVIFFGPKLEPTEIGSTPHDTACRHATVVLSASPLGLFANRGHSC